MPMSVADVCCHVLRPMSVAMSSWQSSSSSIIILHLLLLLLLPLQFPGRQEMSPAHSCSAIVGRHVMIESDSCDRCWCKDIPTAASTALLVFSQDRITINSLKCLFQIANSGWSLSRRRVLP